MTTESGAKSRLSCAVVVGADGKYRALVATDAEAITVTGKPHPVLVHRHTDALYGVPVRPVTLAVREGVAKSAKQIALSLSMYSQDYDALMPLAAHDVAKDIAPYLKSDNVFRDPRTGENAFTYT